MKSIREHYNSKYKKQSRSSLKKTTNDKVKRKIQAKNKKANRQNNEKELIGNIVRGPLVPEFQIFRSKCTRVQFFLTSTRFLIRGSHLPHLNSKQTKQPSLENEEVAKVTGYFLKKSPYVATYQTP